MTLTALIKTYGYVIIFLGTFIEGETTLVLGGFIAHQNYLLLPGVIVVAFLGSLSNDMLFFYLGRRHGGSILNRRPAWQDRVHKVTCLLERYDALTILLLRFLYGLRTVAPFVIGMSRIRTARFIGLAGLGAAIWSIGIGVAGYLFGRTLSSTVGPLRRYEFTVLGLLVMAGAITWALYRYRHRMQTPK